MTTAPRGFALLSEEQRRALGSRGGKSAHEKGTARQWNRETASEAGRKGAAVTNAARRAAVDALPMVDDGRRGRADRLAAALRDRTCIDVRTFGEQVADGPGLFILPRFVEGRDWCDAREEAWIWSIGRHKLSGAIYAATDARFYQHPEFDCLWMR